MNIEKKIHDKIYKLLELFDKESKKINLDYMIDGGTLLGADRHNKIIPWDDDGDLMIEKNKLNNSKLIKIFKVLKKYDIDYYKFDLGYKIFFNDSELIPENLWLTHVR